MGTHPIFESDFDCLTDLKSGFLNMSAKNSAKAALKGKNNLRKKKVRTTVHFRRPATLRQVPDQIVGEGASSRSILDDQTPTHDRVGDEKDRRQQHARLYR